MIKALIIDDEKNSRDTLRGFVENYCEEIQIIDEAESAEQGIKQIKKLQPQLIFLDIEFPLGSGFDLLEACKHCNFDVIFTIYLIV